MKTKKPKAPSLILVLGLLATLNLHPLTAHAQGTAFTYQGRLEMNGSPAPDGQYVLAFNLYDAVTNGLFLAQKYETVGVTNGLFTSTVDYDNPALTFPGAARWLEIQVATNLTNTFVTLSPRQPITPTPYAILAESVPRLTVQPNTNGAPNVLAGSPVNFVSNGVSGATISGGGALDYDGTSYTNSVTDDFGTVGGGAANTASGYCAAVGGGFEDTASSYYATVAGGYNNAASGYAATVAGGFGGAANGTYATVGGGYGNTAGSEATVGGGQNNTASGTYATVSGGANNTANDNYAMVAGGLGNVASGKESFAAGTLAHASHDGSFVWADDSDFNFSSTTTNQFRVRATGGVAFATAIDSSGSVTSGVHLLSGDTAWSSISDRNAKKNFQPVDGESVLEKLAAIPVEQWNYKWEADTNTPHIGPMAQDFKGAFYPGRDDKSITTLEFDGVELAAIQGLNQKLEAQAKEKNARISALEKELSALKQAVAKLSNGKN